MVGLEHRQNIQKYGCIVQCRFTTNQAYNRLINSNLYIWYISAYFKCSIMLITTPPKKSTSFDLSIFLFKPQAWYVITRQRVWHRRRRMESPKVHFLRLDSIPSCNGFHTMLCIDSIHASRRDVANGVRKLR